MLPLLKDWMCETIGIDLDVKTPAQVRVVGWGGGDEGGGRVECEWVGVSVAGSDAVQAGADGCGGCGVERGGLRVG